MPRIRYGLNMGSSEIIRAMRNRAGFTQAELARRSRISRAEISAYERGTRQPLCSTLMRLADACGETLTTVPRPKIDVERNSRILLEVLALAEELPHRPAGPLMFPPLGKG